MNCKICLTPKRPELEIGNPAQVSATSKGPKQVLPKLMTSISTTHVPSGQQAISSGDWVEHHDPKTGKKYYYNRVTKTSQWQLPTEAGTPHRGVTNSKPLQDQTKSDHKALSKDTSVDKTEQIGNIGQTTTSTREKPITPDQMMALITKLIDERDTVPSWIVLKHYILDTYPEFDIESVKSRAQRLLQVKSEDLDAATRSQKGTKNADQEASNQSDYSLDPGEMESGCFIEPAITKAKRMFSEKARTGATRRFEEVMESGCLISIEVDN